MPNAASFGRDMRSQFFLEDKCVPLNHGAFGVCPRSLHPVLHSYQNKMEAQPDRFLRRDVFQLQRENRERLAEVVHCDPSELAFAVNASYGINSIVRSLPFNEGDKFLYFNTAYPAVERTLAFLQDHHKVKLVPVILNYPLSDQEILDLTKETIERELTADPSVPIRAALFDAISSAPGVLFPFEAMIKLVKEHNILSIVDGAHAVGQIPLNLNEADPDFFVSNCHKWLFVPRAVAFIYAPKRSHALIHPSIINYAYKSTRNGERSNFEDEFGWPGTMDFSSTLCVGAALDFRKSIGGEEAIQKYCNDLARKGGQLVADICGTEVLENEDKTLTVAMTNVLLPFKNKRNMTTLEAVNALLDKWMYDHDTVGSPYIHNGKWYVRLSAQIYNDLEDFRYFADTVHKVCKELDEE
ncbi:pyridoxal phosphate-dependent transferase [Fennellomyces sp. T-0311]|nr:pyridoxal phosphate-dependent transferase [Fennellomyces sp. T-0311]